MEIESIFEEPLIISMDSTVSKAVAKMLDSGRHEVLVKDGDDFCGVLSAADLVKTNIATPEDMGIRQFVKHINPLHFMTEPGDLLNTMLINDYKSLPVEKDDNIFIITKLGLLKLFRKKLDLKGKTVDDVMNFPFVVDTTDGISTARGIMRDMSVSVVVVVDEKDRVEGVVDTLALLRAIIARFRSRRGEEDGEKIRLDNFPIKSIASNDFVRVEAGTALAEGLEKMINRNTPSLVVEHDGKLVGLVTPKDILKLAGNAVEGVHVTISGMHEEDNFVKSLVNEEIERELKKLGKIMQISHFVMHLRKYHEAGRTVKYSVHARLFTPGANFFAEDYAWDLTKATKGVLSKLEKELIRKQGKIKEHKRAAHVPSL